MTAALIDHEDTWARAKELANYMEEDSDSKENKRIAFHEIEEDVTWVRLKQSTSQRFAQQAESKKDIGAKKMEIQLEYSQFKCIFEKKKSERLPEHQPWDHVIELKPDLKEKLKKKKTVTYLLPPKLKPVFNDWLDENLRKGYIQPSSSEVAAGLFFVGKKQEGDYQACQDYRDLNEATIKDKYPLPLVPDLLLKFQGS
jgi:cell pole-organizing protein PopZ